MAEKNKVTAVNPEIAGVRGMDTTPQSPVGDSFPAGDGPLLSASQTFPPFSGESPDKGSQGVGVVNPEIAGARGDSGRDSSAMPQNDRGVNEQTNNSLSVQSADNANEQVESADMEESERIANSMLDISDSAFIEDCVKHAQPSATQKDELMDFMFPWRPDEYKFFECSINCVKYRFEKGVPVKIPRCVYELYITLNKDLVTADKIKSGMPQNV